MHRSSSISIALRLCLMSLRDWAWIRLREDAYELPLVAMDATPGPGSTGAKVAAQLQRRPVESRVTK